MRNSIIPVKYFVFTLKKRGKVSEHGHWYTDLQSARESIPHFQSMGFTVEGIRESAPEYDNEYISDLIAED